MNITILYEILFYHIILLLYDLIFLFFNSLNSLEKFEAKAFETAERSIAALNFNVNAEIQTLFDRLNFM